MIRLRSESCEDEEQRGRETKRQIRLKDMIINIKCHPE
jgi:hypothetical protein